MSETFTSFSRLKTVVPENENESSGPCLRDALAQAGIDTNLPDWPDVAQLPEICDRLGLKLFQGQGRTVSLNRKGEYILGHIVDRSKPLRLGHFTFTDDIETAMQEVNEDDLFAVMQVPEKSG